MVDVCPHLGPVPSKCSRAANGKDDVPRPWSRDPDRLPDTSNPIAMMNSFVQFARGAYLFKIRRNIFIIV